MGGLASPNMMGWMRLLVVPGYKLYLLTYCVAVDAGGDDNDEAP